VIFSGAVLLHLKSDLKETSGLIRKLVGPGVPVTPGTDIYPPLPKNTPRKTHIYYIPISTLKGDLKGSVQGPLKGIPSSSFPGGEPKVRGQMKGPLRG
jgi:hypothetical protein